MEVKCRENFNQPLKTVHVLTAGDSFGQRALAALARYTHPTHSHSTRHHTATHSHSTHHHSHSTGHHSHSTRAQHGHSQAGLTGGGGAGARRWWCGAGRGCWPSPTPPTPPPRYPPHTPRPLALYRSSDAPESQAAYEKNLQEKVSALQQLTVFKFWTITQLTQMAQVMSIKKYGPNRGMKQSAVLVELVG